MTAEELINPLIPALKPSDTVQRALAWMEEFAIRQLPVVQDRRYLGMVSEAMLMDGNQPEALIGSVELIAEKAYVGYFQHFYEVIRIAIDNGVHTVAVLDEDQLYAGVVTVNDTLAAFAQSYAVQRRGGILVLALTERDYSLSEISRLIESNDMKVLSAFVTYDEQDANRLRLTLKLNQTDISHATATLERFGYHIVAQFHENEAQDSERERLDILLKYLNI
ncbi:CBS domain-containing protein [Catalinimonas alkaloidigena]|uniref:CBS domain-containing protein n=1 Tax=Catalinimonas alkaloidigena TaxID=1075417 RepID=A0A1G9DUK0_9BACT|nr:CBS domain-containing protein [Catalinimonas alkaloidigena]SDK67561.1 CBS domain-containing protein [Catalinimonas alkaloidigena]